MAFIGTRTSKPWQVSCGTVLTIVVLASQSSAKFRSIDGTGNNPNHDQWGAAGTMLLRRGSGGYTDGVAAPSGASLHSARVISNVVCSQPGPVPNSAQASDYLFWRWGQFLDHDLDLTDPHPPAEPFDIKVPKGDPWFDPSSTGAKTIALSRTHQSDVAITAVRQQFNSITAYIDASNVYGSEHLRAQELRRLGGTGMLKTSPGDLLLFNVNGFANAPTDFDYQRVMSPTLVASLAAQTLSPIIRNNTNIGNELQDNAFLVQ